MLVLSANCAFVFTRVRKRHCGAFYFVDSTAACKARCSAVCNGSFQLTQVIYYFATSVKCQASYYSLVLSQTIAAK